MKRSAEKLLLSALTILYSNLALAGRSWTRRGGNFDSTEGMPPNKYVTGIAIVVVATFIVLAWKHMYKKKKVTPNKTRLPSDHTPPFPLLFFPSLTYQPV